MTYTAPTVSKIGTFEEITQSTNRGSRLDAAFNGQGALNNLS